MLFLYETYFDTSIGISLSWHWFVLYVTGECNHYIQVTATIFPIIYVHSFVVFWFVVMI